MALAVTGNCAKQTTFLGEVRLRLLCPSVTAVIEIVLGIAARHLAFVTVTKFHESRIEVQFTNLKPTPPSSLYFPQHVPQVGQSPARHG
jgi:hypothetical protein